MLNESQQAQLDAVVRELGGDIFVESARFDTHTLELVLCREFVCFRPLHITEREVDITAALTGDVIAQQALGKHLQSKLEGLL